MSRIVYISWPAREITGGVKSAFHHVDALRRAGFDAVVASNDTTPPGWFDTPLDILPLAEIARGDDILVMPENHHGFLERFADWPNRKVVLCLNHFYAHRGLGRRAGYGDYGVAELIVPGIAPAAFCRERFPDLNVTIVPPFIDPEVFAPGGRKRLAISFVPRKRKFEAMFINDLFRARYAGDREVRWVELSNAREAEVAKTFADTAVHLSLCSFEATPMTPLEAMASGCIVAGFAGFGGNEYATDMNGFWAAEDDVIECARQLGRAVDLAARGGALYDDMIEAGTATARRYGRERFETRLIAFWSAMLDGSGVGGAADAKVTGTDA